jgi:hypothetical protein
MPSVQLVVGYQTLGIYDQAEGYTAGSSNAPVAFHVQQQNDAVTITEIKPTEPHVSARAALAWMKSRLADPTTSDMEQIHLKDAIAALSKQIAPGAATR